MARQLPPSHLGESLPRVLAGWHEAPERARRCSTPRLSLRVPAHAKLEIFYIQVVGEMGGWYLICPRPNGIDKFG